MASKKKGKRTPWDEYFLKIADLVATRSTCPRLHVGAVLVRERMIVSSGYNGSPRKSDQCDEVGCRMVNGHCVATIHAEENAVLQAAYHGIATKGATLYTNYFPCEHCVKTLINAGVKEIVYREVYKNIDQPFAKKMLRQAGVKTRKVES